MNGQDTKRKPKIFLWAVPFHDPVDPESANKGQQAWAMAEDGEGLARELASSVKDAQAKIGLTTDAHHPIFEWKYPGGYELVWMEYQNLDKDELFQAAYRANQRTNPDVNGEFKTT